MGRGFGRIALLTVMVLLVACGGLMTGAYLRVSKGGKIHIGSYTARIPFTTTAFNGRDEITLLFLGVDEHSRLNSHSPQRTDSILLTRINLKKKTLVGLSIPRDTLVEIPGRSHPDKVNAAHAYGSSPLAIQTISQFTGVPIDYYIKTDSAGFKTMVDRVGGIWINVEKDMSYDDNWGKLHIHLKKGYQKLTGEQAVGYVRFRHDASSDFGRMARQQKFIKAIATQVLTAKNMAQLPAIVQDARMAIETNMTVGDLLYLVNEMRGVPQANMQFATVPGDPRRINGISYLLPHEKETEELVQNLFHSPGPAASPSEDDARTVEVLNGSGKKGAAKEFARRLEENGYKVVRVANASGAATDHPSSEVLFRTTNANTAREIADMVGGATVVADTAGLASESGRPRRRSEPTGYTVILGQDYQTEEQL